MRRLIPLLLLMCCTFPAYAVDWHLSAEAGVNEEENLETRLAFHVQRWYMGLEGRQTAYGEPTAHNGLRVGCYPWRLSPASLTYEDGLQWRASLHYRAFTNSGPAVNYTRISDQDATYFVGWRVVVGSP
jgi:hypothetical protein